MSEKRKALLVQKEKILAEIKYYEKRIEEARTHTKKSNFCEDDDSSDNDTDLFLFDNGPSFRILKQQQMMLQTCLQATQELTSLEVLQSEVNVLVEDPQLNGASPAKGEGVWREVVAECCLDLVPFAITFYAFKANRSFAPIEYRSLKVTAIKKAHEVEISKSVLPGLTRPSDAIEVIRSYSLAHRSRRTTLARLANKFGNSLLLEPIPEGGYLMKCANLLEVSWTLQNKWSPVAPFHHRMKFDLEYMDEAYIRTITQAHRQLSEPDVDTDERTHLLAKIISTCLEAQGPTQELHDSMSSDPETAHSLHKRRTTLDREPEAPSVKRAKTDREVMAPPKEPPKKAKKGRENVESNKKTTKRPIEQNENVDNPKKAKTTESTKEKEKNAANNAEINDENNVATSKNNKQSENATSKNNPKKSKNVESAKGKEENDANNAKTSLNAENSVTLSKNDERSEKSSAVSTSESIKKKPDKNVANKETTVKKADQKQVKDMQNTERPTSANKIKKSSENTAKPVSKAAVTNENAVKPKENAEKSNHKIIKSNKKAADKVVKPDKIVESAESLETNAQITNTTDIITKNSHSDDKVRKEKGTAKVVKKVVPKNLKNDIITKNNVQSKTNNEGATINKTSKNKVASDKNATSKNNVAGDTVGKITKKIVSTKQMVKKPATDKNVQKVKKVASAPNINAKVIEKVKAIHTVPGKTNVVNANKNANVASSAKNPTNSDKVSKVIHNMKADKEKNLAQKLSIVSNKPKATVPSKNIITGNTKALNDGNPGKENALNNLKISKIPLKKISSENALKLPLRASPRQPLKTKIVPKFGSETKVKSK